LVSSFWLQREFSLIRPSVRLSTAVVTRTLFDYQHGPVA